MGMAKYRNGFAVTVHPDGPAPTPPLEEAAAGLRKLHESDLFHKNVSN